MSLGWCAEPPASLTLEDWETCVGRGGNAGAEKEDWQCACQAEAEGGLLMLATSFFVCEIHSQRTRSLCCVLAQTGATGKRALSLLPSGYDNRILKKTKQSNKVKSCRSNGNFPRQQTPPQRSNLAAQKKKCIVVVVLAVCYRCLDMAKKFPSA